MNRWFTAGLLLVLLLALALRLPRFNERPMHNDEAVNAIKFGQLWQHGTYKYDPNEHHGPTLYYATLAFGKLTGAPDFDHYSENRLRWVTVVFGAGLILLLPLFADGLGKTGVLWAGLFMAVSPAMVFYSGYYIHEMLLVFFTMLALGAGWRYWQTRRLEWALLAGLGLGLMSATKETFPFTLVAAGLALLANRAWNRAVKAGKTEMKGPGPGVWAVIGCLAVWFVVASIFFTSFFSNSSGLLDAVRAYKPWIHRAEGNSVHVHALGFYFHRLLLFHPARGPFWSEGLILLLAGVGAAAGFLGRKPGEAQAGLVRFLAIFTVVLAAIYSLIPYKTPWCLLNFWSPMILLAGFGAAVLLKSLRWRTVQACAAIILLAGAAHLAWQAWLAETAYAADQRNPYVYAQTSPDILNLTARVQSLANASPEKNNTVIKVMAPGGDYWPLPWYFRGFKHVGWYDKVPADPYAPVIIAGASLHADLDENKDHVMLRYFALRPGTFLELYVQTNLWSDWLAKHPAKIGAD